MKRLWNDIGLPGGGLLITRLLGWSRKMANAPTFVLPHHVVTGERSTYKYSLSMGA